VIHSATFWNQNVHAPLIEKIFKDLIVNFPFNQTWIQYRKFLFPPTEPPNTEKRNTYLFFLKKLPGDPDAQGDGSTDSSQKKCFYN